MKIALQLSQTLRTDVIIGLFNTTDTKCILFKGCNGFSYLPLKNRKKQKTQLQLSFRQKIYCNLTHFQVELNNTVAGVYCEKAFLLFDVTTSIFSFTSKILIQYDISGWCMNDFAEENVQLTRSQKTADRTGGRWWKQEHKKPQFIGLTASRAPAAVF